MSYEQYQSDLGLVGETVRELLEPVNAGFNWDVLRERYDPDPERTAMGLFFTDGEGERPVERIYLGIKEGPELVIIDQLDDSWDYVGNVVTLQDYGLRVIDPDDEMTPQRARVQYNKVRIDPTEGQSREMLWMVSKNLLNVMLNVIRDQSAQAAAGGGGGR